MHGVVYNTDGYWIGCEEGHPAARLQSCSPSIETRGTREVRVKQSILFQPWGVYHINIVGLVGMVVSKQLALGVRLG